MNNFDHQNTILGIIILVFVLIVIQGGFWMHGVDRYREGQIDALTGKIKYKLVIHHDSTRTWVRIPKP